jgi:hypothetical protein
MFIKWKYRYDKKNVHENEELWSTIEERYVPIGSEMIHTLIFMKKVNHLAEVISWINEKGVYSAYATDFVLSKGHKLDRGVIVECYE